MVTPTFVNGQHKVVDLNTDDFNVVVKHLTKLFNDNHSQDPESIYTVVAYFKMAIRDEENGHTTLVQRLEYQLNKNIDVEDYIVEEVLKDIKSLLNSNVFSHNEWVSNFHAKVYLTRKKGDKSLQIGGDNNVWLCY